MRLVSVDFQGRGPPRVAAPGCQVSSTAQRTSATSQHPRLDVGSRGWLLPNSTGGILDSSSNAAFVVPFMPVARVTALPLSTVRRRSLTRPAKTLRKITVHTSRHHRANDREAIDARAKLVLSSEPSTRLPRS